MVNKIHLSLIVIITILFSQSGFAQRFLMDSEDYRMKVEFVARLDSIEVLVSFVNKSDKSVFIEAQTPLKSRWSITRKQLTLEFGTDLKTFTEAQVVLYQINPKGRYEIVKKIPYHKAFFDVNLITSLFVHPQIQKEAIRSSEFTNAQGRRFFWMENYFPINLSNKN